MARKKASHPPPKSPLKLRKVIEAGMLNIDRIPLREGADFDSTAWRLFSPGDEKVIPDIIKTVEDNLDNPSYIDMETFVSNSGPEGWYLWSPTSGQKDEWIIWLSLNQVLDKSWDTMDFMQLHSPEPVYHELEYPVKTIYQNDSWGHQDDFVYALILPTDENKMWVSLYYIGAINWKRFPKVLVEGA